MAARCWWKRAFYRLKDGILRNFGIQEGFTLQEWDDLCWRASDEDLIRECCQGVGEKIPFATHYHILEMWSLSGHILHQPTNEYRFTVWCDSATSAFSKESQGYLALHSQVTGKTIKGKKRIVWENKAPAWRALLRLARRFRGVLLEINQMSVAENLKTERFE